MALETQDETIFKESDVRAGKSLNFPKNHVLSLLWVVSQCVEQCVYKALLSSFLSPSFPIALCMLRIRISTPKSHVEKDCDFQGKIEMGL